MPVNIIVGLVALLVALSLYSIGTWSAFRAKGFSARSVAILWVGVVFDLLATVMMGLQVGGLDLRTPESTLHTVLALLAMAGMIAGAGIGTWSVSAKRADIAARASRLLVAPWALWVAVFIWGMATRGAARMGG
jgi:hypothetical protein